MSFISSKRVAVLRGGDKHFDTSIKTGSFILKNIPKEFEVLDVFIDKSGIWHLKGVPKKPESILSKIDFVWNALHGGFGENGKLQKLLEHFGIKHTSSPAITSSVFTNKHISKDLFKKLGVKTPHHISLDKDNINSGTSANIFLNFPHPAIVKPSDLGHSIGVSFVQNIKDLSEALDLAFSYSPKIIIEEYINGREFFVGVIENFRGQKNYTLPIVEIKKEGNIFDNQTKLSENQKAQYAHLNEDLKKDMVSISKNIVSFAGVKNYAGLDFIVSPKRGIYLLEVNTQPQILENSPFQTAMTEAGITPNEFVWSVLQNL